MRPFQDRRNNQEADGAPCPATNQIDYIALGNFLWCASLATHRPPAKDDPLWDWLNRGVDLFGGVGRDPRLHPLAAD